VLTASVLSSLESLAKGVVCFSHKFNLQELQDRWYSLLYDSETSAKASARMAKYEMELSVSDPAKTVKLFNSKTKCFSLCKRKMDSVKNQYYAIREFAMNHVHLPILVVLLHSAHVILLMAVVVYVEAIIWFTKLIHQ